MNMFKYFSYIILVQLFYSFGVTLLSHTLTPLQINSDLLYPYQSITTNMENITSSIEQTTNKQLNIPYVDIGVLVFYSGNIIVDMMLNFFFAVPSMISILVEGFTIFFNMNAYLVTQLKLLLYSIVSVIYFINLLAFLMEIRSRGNII